MTVAGPVESPSARDACIYCRRPESPITPPFIHPICGTCQGELSQPLGWLEKGLIGAFVLAVLWLLARIAYDAAASL
jgi:hypothetical protein